MCICPSMYITYPIYVQTKVFESHMMRRTKRKQNQRGIIKNNRTPLLGDAGV